MVLPRCFREFPRPRRVTSPAGNLTTFFADQLGTWDAHARRKLDEALPQEVLEERMKGLMGLDGWFFSHMNYIIYT